MRLLVSDSFIIIYNIMWVYCSTTNTHTSVVRTSKCRAHAWSTRVRVCAVRGEDCVNSLVPKVLNIKNPFANICCSKKEGIMEKKFL